MPQDQHSAYSVSKAGMSALVAVAVSEIPRTASS